MKCKKCGNIAKELYTPFNREGSFEEICFKCYTKSRFWRDGQTSLRIKRKKKMSIKIKVKQELYRGDRIVKILKIEGLYKEQLPAQYFRESLPDTPAVYVLRDQLFFENKIVLQKYTAYSPGKVKHWIEICRKAGKHLKNINEKLKKENEDWTKEVTYII